MAVTSIVGAEGLTVKLTVETGCERPHARSRKLLSEHARKAIGVDLIVETIGRRVMTDPIND
jgi:hypothetical protein